MQFMMLMIPNAYRDNKMEAGFAPDLEKMEPMGRFNEELGKAVKILSVNGLHPLSAAREFRSAKGSRR